MAGGKTFLVTESEILDTAAPAACTPTVRAALVAAGNRQFDRWPDPAGGRRAAAAQAGLDSAALAALAPQREKAYRMIRLYLVEEA